MNNKILVAVDLSTPAITEKVCQVANDMAQKFGSKVQLVTILQDYGSPLVASFFPEGAQDKIKEELHAKLSELASNHFDNEIKTAVIHGSKRSNSILAIIDEIKPDLAILGCRRKHSREGQRLLGSTTLAVTDRSSCSVMIVKS